MKTCQSQRRWVMLKGPIVNACPLPRPPPVIARVRRTFEGKVRICLGKQMAGRRVHLRMVGLSEDDDQGPPLRAGGKDVQVRRPRLDMNGGTTYEMDRAHNMILRTKDEMRELRILHLNDIGYGILRQEEFCRCEGCDQSLPHAPV